MDEWKDYLPDRAEWSDELIRLTDNGDYMYLRHNKDWVIVLSLQHGDVIRPQQGMVMQARMAISRVSCEVVRPTPGTRIGEWQADLLGYGEQYRRSRELVMDESLYPVDWESDGDRMMDELKVA